jgi:O-antigen/teichoic acid export membrane protein
MALFANLKRLFTHSAIYGLGHILNRSLVFILLPLYTNVLPSAEFGIAGLLFTYMALLTMVYMYGLDAGFLRYYMDSADAADRRQTFATAFWTCAASSVLLSLLFGLAAPFWVSLFFSSTTTLPESQLQLLVVLMSVILLFDSLAFLPMLVLRAEEKSWQYILLKFANVLINVAANGLAVLKWNMGLVGIFWANVISSSLTFLLTLPLVWRHGGLQFSKSRLEQIFVFGLPALPAGLAIAGMDTVDRIFLERMTSLQSLGLYNAGARLGMIMALFVAAFRFAWPPFFLSIAHEPDSRQVFSRIFTYLLLACSLVFVAVAMLIEPLAQVRLFGFYLIGVEYWDGLQVVPVIMLAYIFYAAYLNFYVGVYLEKRTRYIMIATVAGLVANLLGNALLIPHLNFMGAAWARLFGYAVMAGVLLYFSQKVFPIAFEWHRILKMAVVLALVYILGSTAFVRSHVCYRMGMLVLYPVLLTGAGFFRRTELKRLLSGWIS